MNFFETLERDTQKWREDFLATPLIHRCMSEAAFSREEYLTFLTQAYHHVKHTVPLLMAAGSRLPMNREPFRVAIADYINEEVGHQEWILNDIAAVGGDKAETVASTPLPATEFMVAYAYDTVTRNNPMAFFGMVLVLEGTSINLATAAADIIQRHLDLPNQAFSYLRSHGSLDQEHMVFFEKLMNSVEDPTDQQAIIHAARLFYRLYGDVFRDVEQSCATPCLSKASGE